MSVSKIRPINTLLSNSRRLIRLILLLVLILALYLRVEGVLRGDFAYTYDVGRDLLRVREIVVDHDLTLLGPTTGIHGLFYGPWWYYFLAVPFALTGGNPTGIAVFINLLGWLAVIGGYFFGKKLWNTHALFPLIFSAILAFSGSIVEFSTQIWSPDMLPLLLVMWLFTVLGLLKRLRYSSLFVGLLSGLILEAEVAFGIFFLLAGLTAGLIWIRDKFSLRKIFWLGAGLFAVFLPRVLFELRHDFITTRNLWQLLSSGQLLTAKISLLNRLGERLTAFFGTWNNTLANGNSYLGGVLLLLAVFVLSCRFRYLNSLERRFTKLLASMIVMIYLLFSLYGGDFWWYYIQGLGIFFALLLVVALRQVAVYLPERLFYLLTGVYMLFLLQPQKIWESIRQPSWEGDAAVYRNVEGVVREVYADAGRQEFNYIVYTPPVVPHTYDYLFLWFGRKKDLLLPIKENQKWQYSIIEPDVQHPQLRDEWIKLHKDDGELIWEKEMPGGILLQKRRRHEF